MELSVLFWNVDGNEKDKDYKPVIETVSELTEVNKFDLIILAECKDESVRDEIEKQLKMISENYIKGTAVGSKLAVFHHNLISNGNPIKIIHEQRYCYFIFEKTLIVGVHLLSRYPNLNGNHLYEKIKEIKLEIIDLADENGTENIIITGDFNLDPFEHGMTAADGFNATFSKEIALRPPIKRNYTKKIVFKHPYFYNPSWHLHGNVNNSVQGTYYKGDSEYRVQFHMLDQVIVSKEFLPPYFDLRYFSIIDAYKNVNGRKKKLSKNNGQPDDYFSDHYPIKFRIQR